MNRPDRIHIPFKTAASMVISYIKQKLSEQIKAVAFVILYLAVFKIIVLNEPPVNAIQIAFGVGLVVLGLALFLEGLFLGLMPLGERVGVLLPQKTGIFLITAFGLFIGFCATLAEPSISTLQHAKATVTPWETPLLYRLLENNSFLLVCAVCIGVSVAVALGMIKFYYSLSMKPFLYAIVPVVIGVSAWFACDENLCQIINLAWDTGGVTTGPVTVPLVLALGIGISKVSKKRKGASSAADGFGVIALASLAPVLAVLIAGAFLNTSTAKPVAPEKFFSPQYRQEALKLVESEQALKSLAFTRAGENARRAYFANEQAYRAALRSLLDSGGQKEILLEMSVNQWLSQKASSKEQSFIALESAGSKFNGASVKADAAKVFTTELKCALRAVVPLVLLLLIVLMLMLKSRLKRPDEVTLGIFFSILGLAILTSGIRLGFAPLGDQVGRPLPQVFKSETRQEGKLILEPFDESSVITAYGSDGVKKRYIYVNDKNGHFKTAPYEPARYDRVAHRYEHIVEKPPRFGPEMTLLGIILVFLFAFGMGYGSTVAEPALNALGITVEEITVGTVKKQGVVGTVSLGVGLGLMVGVARILYNIPSIFILAPSYLVLIFLTRLVDDDFAGIAWDSGGVTTGPITVPLVLAMGLGISGGLNVVDGFGIVAMASLFPIMTMLLYGIIAKRREHKLLRAVKGEEHNEN